MSDWKCPDGYEIQGAVFIREFTSEGVEPVRMPNSTAFETVEPSSEFEEEEVVTEQKTQNGFGLWYCSAGDYHQEDQLLGDETFDVEIKVKLSVSAKDGNLAEQQAIRTIEQALFQAGVDQDGIWSE